MDLRIIVVAVIFVSILPFAYSQGCEIQGHCGDGSCGGGEDCNNCPGDCGSCPVSCGGCGSCADSRYRWCTGGQYGSGRCIPDCEGCKTKPQCGNGRCEDGQGCWADETSSNCPVDCGPQCYPPSCTVSIGGDGSYSFTSSGDADGQLEYTCCGPTYGCISSGGVPTSGSGCCLPPGSQCTLTVSNSCGTFTCSSSRQCECSPGSIRSCTINGCPGTQTCFNNGCTWDPCRDIPNDNCPCSSLQGWSCGSCGTIDCNGNCVNQGPCSRGQTEYGGSCGKCGTSRRDCASNCQWGGWYCTGEGPCSRGQTEYGGSCGKCGTSRRDCQSNCQYGGWNCVNQGTCSPGQTETQTQNCGAGSCGTQSSTRACSSSCSWGSWSAWSSCTLKSGNACFDGSTQCSGSRYQTCSGCQWQNSGTDADKDGVDAQCGDSQCDNAAGVTDATRTPTENACTDGLDNDCDLKTDCNDNDCDGSITGSVKNQDEQSVSGADISAKKDLTTIKSSTTNLQGTYSFGINCGTYNLVASHIDYAPQAKSNVNVPPKQQVTADFSLVLGTSCEPDCTFAADNIIHASCDGKNGCTFYDSTAKAACDNSQPGWVRDYSETHYVICASGSPQPKIEILASVSCASGTLVKVTRIVVYNGKPVKLVVAACG